MGGPSIPPPPPPPDPNEAARANELFYRSSLETYIQNQPDIAELETRLREKYAPRQRELERRQLALDSQAAAQAGLQIERELGPQRTLEDLRRQFEMNPTAFALNRAMGDQQAMAFARLYGQAPMSAVPFGVSSNAGTPPVDYLAQARQSPIV